MPNWKKVIVSGSDAVLNSLNVVTALTASGLNYPTTDGLYSGQVIQTNAAGNLTFGDVNGIYQTIKNGEATSLTVGTAVYVSGSQGANPIVYRADAADPNKMPVQYIIPETITAGAIGRGLLLGILEGYNVGSAAAGTLLWVDGNGTLTTTRPTGSSDTTQPIAIVTKTGAGGQLSVLNPGPILLPNLQTGYTWIGNGNNYPIAVATSSIKNVVSSSYASASTSASYTLNATTASTASYVNTLNQNVLITGSLTIGSSSLGSNENTLILGPPPAGGAGEGGQILLQASGGLYTSASMWDNWQNYTRLLRGTNASSDAVVAQFNMHTKQVTFPQYNSSTAFVGTAAAYLAVDNAGNILTTSGSGGSGLSGGSTNYVARWASSILLTTGSIYDSASRVGIGNTSPGYTLDVSGDIRSTGAVYANANGTMYFRGGDDAELWDVNIANTVGVYGQQDQGVASIKLGSGGGIISGRSSSIGIGTTTPISGALHVNGGVFANSFTGSFTGSHIGPLTGTASYATTASYSNTSTSSSYALNATTASYALTATSASYSTNSTTASTASFYGGSVTSASYASNATTAQTASFVNPLNQNVITTGSLKISGSVGITGSLAINAENTNLSFYNTAGTQAIGTIGRDASANLLIQADMVDLKLAVGGFAGNIVLNSTANAAALIRLVSTAGTVVSSSLRVSGSSGFSSNVDVTGSLNVTAGITGSLLGTASTASYVVTAQTASYVVTAQTASFYGGSVTSASYASNATTAQTASFVVTAQTASFVTTAQTASYVKTAQTASFYGGSVTSASYASNATTAQTASFYGGSVTSASYASNATSASYAPGGTVNTGTSAKLAYYPSTGDTVDDAANLEYDGTNLKILSTAQLDFYTNAGSIYFGTFGSPTYGRAGFSVPGQAVMVVDYSNARAGFGGGTSLITSAPAGLVEIQGKTDEIQLLVKGNGTQTNNILEIQKSTGAILYYLDNNGDAKLASGSLGVGIAPNGTDGRIDASNDIVAFSTSDINWKTNIKPIENAIDKVKQISGNTFDWIEDTNPVGKIHGNKGKDIGVIAQEIEKVLPEIVTTRESGTKAVKYEKIVALLIEAIKEQQQQIDELKSKLK